MRAAAGDRASAHAAAVQAEAHGAGPVQAQILIGDLALDAGALDDAIAAYEAVLARAPGHPRALVGRVLAHAAHTGPSPELLGELERTVASPSAHQLSGWLRVARAHAGDPSDLTGIEPGTDRRLVVWLALAHVDRGELVEAARLRALLGAGDPVLTAPLDAELLLARGLPEDAIVALGTRADRRARLGRGLAYLDVRRPEERRPSCGPRAPSCPATRARSRCTSWPASGRAWIAPRPRPRSRPWRRRRGRRWRTRRSASVPHPRRRQWRAPRARARAHRPPAGLPRRRALRRARPHHLGAPARHRAPRRRRQRATRGPGAGPDYLPARALLGRLLVAKDEPAAALAALNPVVAAGLTSAADDLALATALLATGDRERAKDAVRHALQKGALPADVKALATRIDKKFADELPK